MVATDAGCELPVAGDHRSSAFDADPEVGRHLALVDWETTPLGPPNTWEQSLQTAVRILLSSRFSMFMAWGPELTFFCNAAYRRDTMGTKYPWALGRPFPEVWAEVWPELESRIHHVLRTAEATWDAGLLLFLERSGYTEETYHTFSYSPLHNDAGEVVGLLCVVIEETDRVIGERRMATLRDLGSDPSVVRSERQMLEFASQQLDRNLRDLPFTLTYLFEDDGARLAATSGIAAGHPLAPVVPTVEWPVKTVARGESIVIDIDIDTDTVIDANAGTAVPSGDWPLPPTRALIVPLLQQGDAPLGFVVVGLNRYRLLDDGYRGFVELVAGRLAAEIGSARSYQAQQRRAEELAELDRAKTVFFSNISHEFRTPLTLILGPLAELRGRTDGIDDSMREELDVVHRNGLRLMKLVNTLLEFSRIEAGRMQARYAASDLAAVTAELASVFRSAIERAGLDLIVDCPPLDEPVYLDHDMWEKVVLNLLSNALKFTFDGSITVRVRGDGAAAVVTVADTGIGVPAGETSRLFERFHRIETAKARSNEGSGIGLALVHELVGLHGGIITADSVAGAGTTFTIRLPFGTGHLAPDVIDSTGASRAGSAGADSFVAEALRWLPSGQSPQLGTPDVIEATEFAAVPLAGTPARVLIADDNADMREYLARLLRSAGYDVDEVADGQEALDAIRAVVPDLVVSDVMMPRVDGLALVAALRKDPRTTSLPVLLLSARAGQEASIEGLQAGADDYLVKPFAAADLLARVRANVELARLRNHHARWRTALVESLQEAFFVGDENGTLTEINEMFGEIFGYGPEGLPYEPPYPWFPDPDTEPDAHRQLTEGFNAFVGGEQGTYTVPITHRDGHRVWMTFTFKNADDPNTGARVMVGTVRDVTAERYTVQRQTALAELNRVLAQADTVDEALTSTAEELRRVWGARRVLAVTVPVQGEASASAMAGTPEVVCVGEPAQWAQLPARTRESIESLHGGALLATDTTTLGSAGIALQHPRGVLVLWLELAEQRPFAPEDQTLLTVLAGRLGQGLQRVQQLDQQREVALALQHAILGPAVLPGGFAVRYQPASRPLQVGGDWYDLVELDDGRVGLIVGDCLGHGLAAATVMGQLRSACRALLLENPSPRAALLALDRFAARLPGAACTTAFCAVLDYDTGTLIHSSAGHPPPMLVHADRTVHTLQGGRGLPLGLRTDRPRPEATVIMPPRATLACYTDGLVERRRESIERGIDRAASVVHNGGNTPLDALASDIMRGLAPPGGYHDDVALLLYRQPAPLAMTFPPNVSQLAPTRTALRNWLARAGVHPEETQNVLIAAGEAVANAIEHGHRDSRPGTVRLHVSALADRIDVTIADTGVWKVPQPGVDIMRGRGVTLMRALMHDVTIHPDAGGTTVHMNSRISS